MDILFVVLLLFFIELAEATQYKGDRLGEVLSGLCELYKKSIFNIIIFNSSLIYILYVSLEYRIFNFWIALIVLMKISDFFVKLYLFEKMDKQNAFNAILSDFNNIIFDWKLKYFSMFFYTSLFILAFA
ncbi:MAG: hypothetical protein QG567_1257 [Campylobacterota bacterium]|nr:hypothetical protein [Campylobacterota bacterium]